MSCGPQKLKVYHFSLVTVSRRETQPLCTRLWLEVRVVKQKQFGIGRHSLWQYLHECACVVKLHAHSSLPQSCLKYLLPNLCLNSIDGFPQWLGDGLTLQRVDIEAARLCGEDEERYYGDVRVAGLQVVIQSSQSLNVKIGTFIWELISAGVSWSYCTHGYTYCGSILRYLSTVESG